jgi:hypothetical protein
MDLTFSPDDVLGGLYYFTTTKTIQGIARVTFAQGQVSPEPVPWIVRSPDPGMGPPSPSNPHHVCAGCHTVSHEGDKIAATYGTGDDFYGVTKADAPEQFIVPPSPDPMAPPGQIRSNFQWFNKAGTHVVSNFNGELIIRDAATAMEVSRMPKAPEDRAVMPEWSREGDKIAFVRLLPSSRTFYQVADCCRMNRTDGGDWLITNGGDIATVTYANGQWGRVEIVVPALEGPNQFVYHYYPTFAPNGEWIIFNSGVKPGFSPPAQNTSLPFHYGIPNDQLVSYDQETSYLRLVKTTGGTVYDLYRASIVFGATSSWPKFAPFIQFNQQIMFFTFSSKYNYGFKVPPKAWPQLWMAAIDLRRLGENAMDPSFSPIWLPFQNMTTANHLGIWTTKNRCEKDSQCAGGEFCTDRECKPPIGFVEN